VKSLIPREKEILVDSTYLLPLAGVRVKGLPEDPLGFLVEKGFEVKINMISLFEVMGKSLREVERAGDRQGSLGRISIGVKSMLLDGRIGKFPVCEVETINHVIEFFKAGLNDLPDCLICASAVARVGKLLTESKDIKRVVEGVGIKLDVVNWEELISIQ